MVQGPSLRKSAIAAPVPRVSGFDRNTRRRATSNAVLLPLSGPSLVSAIRGAILNRGYYMGEAKSTGAKREAASGGIVTTLATMPSTNPVGVNAGSSNGLGPRIARVGVAAAALQRRRRPLAPESDLMSARVLPYSP